jgi:hypothetical protein
MTDKPILFSAPMVKALLAGTKTQTRRLLNPQPDGDVIHYGWHQDKGAFWTDQSFTSHPLRIWAGDRLYVREAWRTWGQYDTFPPSALVAGTHVAFEATENPNLGSNRGKFRQGMHMPRWASRLTLTVTDVRVQRLPDISEEDAVAEGIVPVQHREGGAVRYSGVGAKFGLAQHTAKAAYAHLWDSINGEDAWSENPWVAAYTFAVQMGNIDQLEAA